MVATDASRDAVQQNREEPQANGTRGGFVYRTRQMQFAVNEYLAIEKISRRVGRAAECGGLENRYPGNWIEGSNPSLSAIYFYNIVNIALTVS